MEEDKKVEEDVKYFNVADYDQNNNMDRLFIEQEILFQRHRRIEARLEGLQNNNLKLRLLAEKEDIEKKAKNNADKIFKIDEEANKIKEEKRKEFEAELKKKETAPYVKKKRS